MYSHVTAESRCPLGMPESTTEGQTPNVMDLLTGSDRVYPDPDGLFKPDEPGRTVVTGDGQKSCRLLLLLAFHPRSVTTTVGIFAGPEATTG